MKSSELAAIDCTLLEFIPNLFRENEVKVNLRKFCESASRKKGASECAGPFRVTIQVSHLAILFLAFSLIAFFSPGSRMES